MGFTTNESDRLPRAVSRALAPGHAAGAAAVTAPVFYTGVGNRKLTQQGVALCYEVGLELARRGLTLRTGDAIGADAAFLGGAAEGLQSQEQTPIAMRRDAEVYRPTDDLPDWTGPLAAQLVGMPVWLQRPPFTRRLFMRSCMQVLGRGGLTPSKFLLCWSQCTDPRAQHGTRVAVRCADQHVTRAALGQSAAPIPWLNLKGLALCDALAFAHQHAGVPVLRPGDVLPARLVPDGTLVRNNLLTYFHADNEWHAVRPPPDRHAMRISSHVSPPIFDIEVIALGLTEETITTDHLRRLAREYEERRHVV